MSRRVPVQPIRGSDPTLLEVQLSEMLRRPLGQLAPVNVMDLIELSGTEGCPRSLERGLAGFVLGVARQIADIPNGRSFLEFLEELQELEGDQVPHRFREILISEHEREERLHKEQITALLERWSAKEPVPFELNVRSARVLRPQERPPKERGGGSSAPSERRSAPRSSGRSGPRAAAAPKDKVVLVDREREGFVRDLVLEMLARAAERGLLETVLVIGVRKQAEARYPDLLPGEVVAVLRALRDANQVRSSAGRWSLPTRF